MLADAQASRLLTQLTVKRQTAIVHTLDNLAFARKSGEGEWFATPEEVFALADALISTGLWMLRERDAGQIVTMDDYRLRHARYLSGRIAAKAQWFSRPLPPYPAQPLVYFLTSKDDYPGLIKLGYSDNLSRRLVELREEHGAEELDVLAFALTSEARDLEALLKLLYPFVMSEWARANILLPFIQTYTDLERPEPETA